MCHSHNTQSTTPSVFHNPRRSSSRACTQNAKWEKFNVAPVAVAAAESAVRWHQTSFQFMEKIEINLFRIYFWCSNRLCEWQINRVNPRWDIVWPHIYSKSHHPHTLCRETDPFYRYTFSTHGIRIFDAMDMVALRGHAHIYFRRIFECSRSPKQD